MVVNVNNASSYIQWQIIRKNSAFLKRQRGIPKHFSTEPFNLARVNSIRHNGLINVKAVDVQPSKDGKGVQVTMKKKKQIGKPAQSIGSITLTKDSRKVLAAIGKTVGAYKPAAAKLAQRRASQIMRSQQKKKKPVPASASGGKKNKAE